MFAANNTYHSCIALSLDLIALLLRKFFGHRDCTLPSFDLYLQIRQGLSSLVTSIEFLNLLEADRGLEALALPCLGYLAVQLVNGFKRET